MTTIGRGKPDDTATYIENLERDVARLTTERQQGRLWRVDGPMGRQQELVWQP